jgi:hypothetical protein
MNQVEFLAALVRGYSNNVEISRNKNSDYATNDDAFKNFRGCEAFGITVEQGILVRMSDKFARIANLLTKEAQVKDERIADTLSDLANYAMILKVYIDNKK